MLKTRDVPQELRDFNSLFFEFQHRHELSRVFDDLLTIIICCMGRGSNEDLYFETIKKYNSKELDSFARLFAELMKIYIKAKKDGEWCDPLGEFYELLASNYKKSSFGQFFTPKSICSIMAQIMINTEEWGLNINEPCSGSGRMVLASNQQAKGNYYVCEDLDPICCKMTAINLCFHEIRGEVHCHDSLARNNHRFSFAVNYEYWKNNTTSILIFRKFLALRARVMVFLPYRTWGRKF